MKTDVQNLNMALKRTAKRHLRILESMSLDLMALDRELIKISQGNYGAIYDKYDTDLIAARVSVRTIIHKIEKGFTP